MNYDKRRKAIDAVWQERDYQDTLWNASTTPTGGVHSNLEFLVFIQDYVQEAFHKSSREAGAELDFTRDSLRKIAALAIAAMEQNGVSYRPR